MKTITLVTCPKCNGSGDIPAFSGIANGVCFRCSGAGKVKASTVKTKVKPLTEWQLGMIAKIKTSDLSNLSFSALSQLRDFAHWHYPQCPELLSVWKERGDEFFFAAQEERLANSSY